MVTPTSSLELAKPCETPYGKVDFIFVFVLIFKTVCTGAGLEEANFGEAEL